MINSTRDGMNEHRKYTIAFVHYAEGIPSQPLEESIIILPEAAAGSLQG
jgi:hypothetical protein